MVVLVGVYHLAYAEARVALAYTFATTLQLKPDALTWAYLQKIRLPLLIDLFYYAF